MTTIELVEDLGMTSADAAREGYTPHAFGEVKLYTKQITDVSLDQLQLNENQPRHRSSWESPELRNQIEQARGLFTPPLVQPLGERSTDGRPKYEVIDGHRRITALRHVLAVLALRHENGTLDEADYQEQLALYSTITVECTHRRLDQNELLKVWILIHRERKEWSLTEKEETAHRLIQLVSLKDAARFLGVTESIAQKLSDVYEIAERIHVSDDAKREAGKDPRITWAREIRNLREDIRDDDEVLESVIARINARQIRNSKDIRVLRDLYPDARAEILDTKKELVRDIALPRGISDPVRATRGRNAETDNLGTALSQMASAIDGIKFEQLQSVRRNKEDRAAARKAISAMLLKLRELEEFVE